jgi:tetratricopeptide (TPR) repeat protein
MDPTDPDPHYHLGRYYYEKQLFTESVEAFETALRIDPRHYRSHYFLGWCQQARGDLEAAKASYEKAIEIIDFSGISYGWPYSDLGDVLIIQGRREAGIKWLRRAVRNDPELPYTHYKYASGLFKTETPGDIEKLLQAAVELDPGYTEAYYLMGRYYQKVGERAKAQASFATFKKLKANPVPSPSGVRR